MTKVGGEDRQAFRRLYDLYGSTLFAVCLKMIRDHDRARDVFQDAFVKVWTNASRYDPAKGDAIAWLVTLTRRCALDHMRRHARLPLPDAELVEAVAGQTTSPDETADTRALRVCLDRLPTDHRRAIVLAFLHGHTHRELAQKLARPLGTVKSWVRRGMEQLKECLER